MTPAYQPKKSRLFSNKPARGKKGRNIQGTVINTAIALLSLLLIAFIFSYSQRSTYNGVPIEVTFPALPNHPTAAEVFNQQPITDIEVEVLNGCGATGIAGIMSQFLRDHQIDVVRSENADHFEYTETLIIQRNERAESLERVASALGVDLKDSRHILLQPDESLDVDVTVIIGRDFPSIQALRNVLEAPL